MNPVFLAYVLRGELCFNNQDAFDRHIQSLTNKSVEIVVRLPRKDRSNPQNRWYWRCVVGVAAEHFGYLPEEMHEAYKFLFLRMHEGGKPETVRSTTTLSTTEFQSYTEKCQQWCAEQGVVIPDPNSIELS